MSLLSLVKFMTTRGVTEAERAAMSPLERDIMADIAFENGYGIGKDIISDRWFFVRVRHPREVIAMQNMWKRGPRKRPHPRSRRRR